MRVSVLIADHPQAVMSADTDVPMRPYVAYADARRVSPVPVSTVPSAPCFPSLSSPPQDLLAAAAAVAAEPTPHQTALLFALDKAVSALAGFDAQLDVEMERQRQARITWEPRVAYVNEDGHRVMLDAAPLPLKSEDQRSLEERRRACKETMQALVQALAAGRMYSEGQIIASAAADLDLATRNPQAPAIAAADLDAALASLENSYARRAFRLRYHEGRSDLVIAKTLGTAPDAISRLCNIALRHAHRALNERTVADVRAAFMNFCLRFGLEFPEYAALRHRA